MTDSDGNGIYTQGENISVKNVEIANLRTTDEVNVDTTGWTGLTKLNVVSSSWGETITAAATTAVTVNDNSYASAGNLVVNGGSSVDVTRSVENSNNWWGAGSIQVLGAAGAVNVTNNVVLNSVSVTGGTTVNVTAVPTNYDITIGTEVAIATDATTGKETISNLADFATGNVTINNSKTTTGVVTYGTANTAVSTNGATNVAVTGANDVIVVDIQTTLLKPSTLGTAVAGTSTLANVALTSVGTTSITSDALTSISLAKSTDVVTAYVAGAHALSVASAGNSGSAAIIDATANAVTITTSGAAADTLAITAAKAATLTIAGTGGAFTLGTLDLGSAASVTATNIVVDGAVKANLGNVSGQTKLTSINASTDTGGVTATLGATTSFAGGAGADSIVLGATTKAITMGDGNDTVTLSSGVTAITGTIAGGNGTDTLSMVAADAATADNSATFASKVTGFERLTLTSPTTNAVDVAVLGNYNYVKSAGATELTLSGLTTGATLELTAAGTAYVATMAGGAVASTTDVLNVVTSNGTGTPIAFGAITAAKVETFNITTADTQTTQTNVTDTMTLTAADAKTINVSGTDGLNLTYTGTTATTIDASGITKGAFTWDSGVVAAASTVKGSATGTNTIDLTETAGIVTYTGGTGNDVIANTNNLNNVYTLGNGANSINTDGAAGNGNNTVTGGTGVDTIKLGNGNNTITTAAGNDVIIVGTGANTISAGDGNDSITVGAAAGLNTINVGAGTDTVILGGVQAAAGYYTSVTGMAAGDKLNFAAVGVVTDEATLGTKITLGGASSFANYLDAAVAGAAGPANWFQFGGNTYVTIDNHANATFTDGSDTVIELVGLVDLSTSVLAGEILTLA